MLVTAAGTGHELVDRELRRLGVDRNVVLSLPNFLGIGALVASTDLMITVPERVAGSRFAIKQHWHERFQQDPANRWLRSVISDLFLEK